MAGVSSVGSALSQMRLEVAMEVTQLGERLGAVGAAVGLLPGVGANVGAQVVLLGERLRAEATVEGALTCKTQSQHART